MLRSGTPKTKSKRKSNHYSIKRQKTDKENILKIEKEIGEIENMPHYLMNMNRKRDLKMGSCRSHIIVHRD